LPKLEIAAPARGSAVMTFLMGMDFGFSLRIAATHKFLILEKTMTDLTLRRSDAPETGVASLVQVLKEMFAATPLGLVLAAIRK
jgi:hypothetical protein